MARTLISAVLFVALFDLSPVHAQNATNQTVAVFTNDLFTSSQSRFEVQTDADGIIQKIRWENPSYQPVPPDHKIESLAKWTALDTYNEYKTIILKGGPIDYEKGEGKFVVGFRSSNGYLQCPFVLRKVGAAWLMFRSSAAADAANAKPIKRVHAIISFFNGVQEVQGGLACKVVPTNF